ncbi:MAG: hypothetical protein WEE89_17035 [Gemmatimonadota bacterium]
MNNRTPDRFSDEQAKAILARAIDLDHRAPTMSADELRAIAADVGISPASLEAAMREEKTALVVRRVVTSRRATRLILGASLPLGAVVGAGLGNLTPALGPGWFIAMAAMGAGLVASAALVVLHDSGSKLRSFLFRNSVLWGGIGTAGIATLALFESGARMPAAVIISWTIRSLITSTVLGSAGVLAVRRARRIEDAQPGDSSGNPEAASASLLTRAARRVFGWLKRPLWRAPIRRLRLAP